MSGASVSDRGNNILPSLNQNSPKVLSDGIVGAIITPGTDTIGVNEGVNPDAESVNARFRSLALSGVQDSGEVGSDNGSTVAAGAVLADPTITDTVHVGAASIPAPNGSAKGNVSGIGPAKGIDANGHAKEIGSGIGSGVFPPHMPLLGTTNDVLVKLHEATKAARETCASHHSTSIKAGANFPYVRALSWAPKKGTNADPLDHGKTSQNEHSGMEAIGARSLKGVSGENGSALTNSNPATEAHLRSFLGLGKSLTSPGKQDEQVRKGDLRGSGLAGNGYDHCNPDFPAAINLEMTNDPPIKSWKSLVSTPVKTGGPLQFYMPHCTDGKIIAKPPVEAVNEGIDMWKGCLVGQFLDKRLPFPVVRSLVNRLWGKREIPDISTTESGLFFFRFRDPEARDWVMNAGPWHLAGRPFILRAWQPGMDMLNIQLSSIPI